MSRADAVVTLTEGAPPDLQQIRARRRQLFRVLILVVVLVSAGILRRAHHGEPAGQRGEVLTRRGARSRSPWLRRPARFE